MQEFPIQGYPIQEFPIQGCPIQEFPRQGLPRTRVPHARIPHAGVPGGLCGHTRLSLPRYQRKYAYQEVSRTLCQPQTKSEMETQYFYVDVSTLSDNTSYQLRVTRVENFVLR